jgi:hypothetical protein
MYRKIPISLPKGLVVNLPDLIDIEVMTPNKTPDEICKIKVIIKLNNLVDINLLILNLSTK